MTVQAILLPVFVEVLLTYALGLWLARLRMADFQSGVRPQDIALREPNWSKRTLQVAYSFSNQFEMPVLFYVLTILALVTKQADLLFVVMAWVFVICRLLQAFVHVTSNKVRVRGSFYIVGALVLLAMWIIFAVEILTLPRPVL